MGLKVGESGKLFGYNTNFDLSSNTVLGLFLTNQLGVQKTILASRITAPAVNATFNESGTDVVYNANEYMQFTIESTDFDSSGNWQVCGVYTNTVTTPDQVYHGDSKSFTVDEAC